MKQMFLAIMALALSCILSQSAAFAQTQNQQTPEEMATAQADKLADLLDLEGWQVFYVDSVLQTNYKLLQDELQDLQKSKVENYDLYTGVRDKWMDRIDTAFKSFFTEDQWAKYLKSGAAKAQKLREKRAQKSKK